MGLITSSNNFVCKTSYNKTFEAVKKALEDCKFSIRKADKKTGEIKASAGISFWSWGETLNISVSKVNKNKTKVSISSGVKAQLIDWGKNKKNIDKFFDALDRRMKKSTT